MAVFFRHYRRIYPIWPQHSFPCPIVWIFNFVSSVTTSYVVIKIPANWTAFLSPSHFYKIHLILWLHFWKVEILSLIRQCRGKISFPNEELSRLYCTLETYLPLNAISRNEWVWGPCTRGHQKIYYILYMGEQKWSTPEELRRMKIEFLVNLIRSNLPVDK